MILRINRGRKWEEHRVAHPWNESQPNGLEARLAEQRRRASRKYARTERGKAKARERMRRFRQRQRIPSTE